MKALSIRQPWAWLIANGYKDVENRSWPTRFRGPFLIHAGKRIDQEGLAWVRRTTWALSLPSQFETGGIVGRAEIVDCVDAFDSFWFFGPYGFVIENARPVRFVAVRGQLGFFSVSVETVEVGDG